MAIRIRAFTLSLTLALCCLALAASAPASQTYPGPPSVEQLARRADVVVVGDVTTADGEWDASRTRIYTRVGLAVAEILKGSVARSLSFTQLGGRVGDRMSEVGGAARFEPGERVLVFLEQRRDGSLRLSDLIHGKFVVRRDAASGRDVAVRFSGAPGADRIELDQVRAEVRRTLGG